MKKAIIGFVLVALSLLIIHTGYFFWDDLVPRIGHFNYNGKNVKGAYFLKDIDFRDGADYLMLTHNSYSFPQQYTLYCDTEQLESSKDAFYLYTIFPGSDSAGTISEEWYLLFRNSTLIRYAVASTFHEKSGFNYSNGLVEDKLPPRLPRVDFDLLKRIETKK